MNGNGLFRRVGGRWVRGGGGVTGKKDGSGELSGTGFPGERAL